jgi:catechol 2,3-dioxygenase-like lactoylglutathione lyase family enzyme
MRRPATGPAMPDRPAHILETALYADDLDAAEAFYAGVLGLERAARAGGRHVFFRLDGAMLLIFNPAETERPPAGGLPVPPHGARGPGHLAFAASGDELDRWRGRLLAAGVAIEADFRWPDGARSIYVRDPAGNSVEFAEPRLWGFG